MLRRQRTRPALTYYVDSEARLAGLALNWGSERILWLDHADRLTDPALAGRAGSPVICSRADPGMSDAAAQTLHTDSTGAVFIWLGSEGLRLRPTIR
jgi:hypothetical protein